MTVLAVSTLVVAPAWADSTAPFLAPQYPAAKAGTRMLVVGKRFPVVDVVTIETCGNIGLRGSSDCDQATAASTLPSPDGTFVLTVTVGNPPVPCPCALVALGPSLSKTVTAMFDVTDHARAKAASPPQLPAPNSGTVKVSHVELHRQGFWPGWFGGRQTATLNFTVDNHGFVALSSPPVVLTVRRAATTTNVPPPNLGVIPPGQSRTYSVKIKLPDGLSYHDIKVQGKVGTLAASGQFSTKTRVVPWGLLIVLLVLVQLALVYARNRARRRLVPTTPAEATVRLATVPDVDAVPDLVASAAIVDLRETAASAAPDEREPALVAVGAVASPNAGSELSTAMSPFEEIASLDVLQYWALDGGSKSDQPNKKYGNGRRPAQRNGQRRQSTKQKR